MHLAVPSFPQQRRPNAGAERLRPRRSTGIGAGIKRVFFECFLSAFPMFVPSRSWQMFGFSYKMAQFKTFSHLRSAASSALRLLCLPLAPLLPTLPSPLPLLVLLLLLLPLSSSSDRSSADQRGITYAASAEVSTDSDTGSALGGGLNPAEHISFFNVSYVCPEPVLVNIRFLHRIAPNKRRLCFLSAKDAPSSQSLLKSRSRPCGPSPTVSIVKFACCSFKFKCAVSLLPWLSLAAVFQIAPN